MGVLGGRSPPNTPCLSHHHGDSQRTSKMMFVKIQNRSMITSIMDNRVLFFRMQSIKAQTRLKRLRTILP